MFIKVNSFEFSFLKFSIVQNNSEKCALLHPYIKDTLMIKLSNLNIRF